MKHRHSQFDVKPSADLSKFPVVKGADFDSPQNLGKLLESYATTGFQATNLSSAISIINLMRKSKATIFLGFTSNIISSGLRDIIRYLVQHKHVQVLVTTAGAIEEDLMKCHGPFHIGRFDLPGRHLLDNGICRTGNLLVPTERYTWLERFMNPVFASFHKDGCGSAAELIQRMGKAINDKRSVLYWAQQNSIPIFCPGIMDGAIGDLVYFARQRHKSFSIDVSKDMSDIVGISLNSEKTAVILLGGGIAKHFTLNANIFRDGADYAVYVNTAEEFDGSDSGARIDEAVSWAKVKPNAPNVKVHCDATIAFPLIVAGSFGKRR